MLRKLLSQFQLGNVTLPNRVIRAAMYEPYAVSGLPSEEIIAIHERHARGGVGLTTTGWFAATSDGRIRPDQVSLSECSVADLTPLVDRVHDAGALIGCNICHMAETDTFPPVYRFPHEDFPEVSDLADLRQKFVDAALLCKEAGFDAIELHHFILSSFVYEDVNPRTDEYGGSSVENRARFGCELIRDVSEAVDGDIPILLKMTMNPPLDGEKLDELIMIGQMYEEAGVDAIIAFKYLFEEKRPDHHDLYTLRPAMALRDAVDIPVVYSCGVDDAADLEVVMEEFELVQIGRSLLRDYDFVNKIAAGEEPDACIKCNQCHSFIYRDLKGKGERAVLKCALDGK